MQIGLNVEKRATHSCLLLNMRMSSGRVPRNVVGMLRMGNGGVTMVKLGTDSKHKPDKSDDDSEEKQYKRYLYNILSYKLLFVGIVYVHVITIFGNKLMSVHYVMFTANKGQIINIALVNAIELFF